MSIVTLQQQVDRDDWLVYGGQERTFVSGDSSELVIRRAWDEVSDDLSDNSDESDSTYHSVDSLNPSECFIDYSHENAINDALDRWGCDGKVIERYLSQYTTEGKIRAY